MHVASVLGLPSLTNEINFMGYLRLHSRFARSLIDGMNIIGYLSLHCRFALSNQWNEFYGIFKFALSVCSLINGMNFMGYLSLHSRFARSLINGMNSMGYLSLHLLSNQLDIACNYCFDFISYLLLLYLLFCLLFYLLSF
jgi:hypothetical protein